MRPQFLPYACARFECALQQQQQQQQVFQFVMSIEMQQNQLEERAWWAGADGGRLAATGKVCRTAKLEKKCVCI